MLYVGKYAFYVNEQGRYIPEAMPHTIHQIGSGRSRCMAIDVRDIYGSQKIENLLNLALEATGEERAKSPSWK